MSVVITSSKVYGPYKEIQALDDRLTCDGEDLCFTVIGDYSISEEDSLAAPISTPAPIVPGQVTRRQALQALRLGNPGAGIEPITEAQIEAAITTIPNELERDLALIEFRTSTAFDRHRPLVNSIGTALGFSSAQIDSLFIAAERL